MIKVVANMDEKTIQFTVETALLGAIEADEMVDLLYEIVGECCSTIKRDQYRQAINEALDRWNVREK